MAEKLGNPKDILQAIDKLQEELDGLRKTVDHYRKEKGQSEKQRIAALISQHNGINMLVAAIHVDGADAAKDIAFQLKNEVGSLFCVLGWNYEEKPGLAVIISDELVASHQLDAAAIVRDLAKEIQGGGGGQKFFATAGGKNSKGLETALDKASALRF